MPLDPPRIPYCSPCDPKGRRFRKINLISEILGAVLRHRRLIPSRRMLLLATGIIPFALVLAACITEPSSPSQLPEERITATPGEEQNEPTLNASEVVVQPSRTPLASPRPTLIANTTPLDKTRTPAAAQSISRSSETATLQQAIVLITEIMADPAVGDKGEWFEVYSSSPESVDLNGWTIRDSRDDLHVIQNGGPLLIPPLGFLVLGVNSDRVVNGGISIGYEYDNFHLDNSGDLIELADASGTIVDSFEYPASLVFSNASAGLNPLKFHPELSDDPANWCASTTLLPSGAAGTPGTINNQCATQSGSPAVLTGDPAGYTITLRSVWSFEVTGLSECTGSVEKALTLPATITGKTTVRLTGDFSVSVDDLSPFLGSLSFPSEDDPSALFFIMGDETSIEVLDATSFRYDCSVEPFGPRAGGIQPHRVVRFICDHEWLGVWSGGNEFVKGLISLDGTVTVTSEAMLLKLKPNDDVEFAFADDDRCPPRLSVPHYSLVGSESGESWIVGPDPLFGIAVFLGGYARFGYTELTIPLDSSGHGLLELSGSMIYDRQLLRPDLGQDVYVDLTIEVEPTG